MAMGITLKQERISSANVRVLKSVCRSCHGGCGALLHVAGDRLVKVEGDPDSPLNRGRR